MTSLSRNCHILQNVSKLSLATLSQKHLVSIQVRASGTTLSQYNLVNAGAEVGFTTATAVKQVNGKQDFQSLHCALYCD